MDLMRSLPLGLYLETPVTWLHRLDSRVKLIWLMSILVIPLLSNLEWRVGIVVALMILTFVSRIPFRVWRQQMGWLLALSLYVCTLISIAPDGLNAEHQTRLPADELKFSRQSGVLPAVSNDRAWWTQVFNPEPSADPMGLRSAPNLPQPTAYRYVVLQKGPITVTERSLSLAIRFSTLLFTLIYSTTLFLLTTSSEEITTGLESLMSPLKKLNVPVTEIALTLTLALRFIPLVLEEFQNLVRSVRTRAIDWKKIGFKGGLRIWLTIAERLLDNLLLRAEQISSAMTVRGFTSPNEHQVVWHKLKISRWDGVAIVVLGLIWLVKLGISD